MRRLVFGALWGVVFYILGYFLVRAVVGSEAVDAYQFIISLVAATLAAAGSWRGFLPGTKITKE